MAYPPPAVVAVPVVTDPTLAIKRISPVPALRV